MRFALLLLFTGCLFIQSCEKQDVEIEEEENLFTVEVTNASQLIGDWNTIAYELSPNGEVISQTDSFLTTFYEDGRFRTFGHTRWCAEDWWGEIEDWELTSSNRISFRIENCYQTTFNGFECDESFRNATVVTNENNTQLVIDQLVTGRCENGPNYKRQALTRR